MPENPISARFSACKRKLFDTYFSKLNDKQREAVYQVNGPLLILAGAGKKAAIMKAINANAGPQTEAGAICFSLPVSSVAGLRQLDPEDAAEAAEL